MGINKELTEAVSEAVIDESITVPDQNSADNVSMADVIGNKTDTIVGTSLVSHAQVIETAIDFLSNLQINPLADSIVNVNIRDVVGNKNDTVSGNSLVSLAKYILKESIEIEKHLHGNEKWFGLASTPSGETHRADRMAGGINPFTLTAGNNTWGNWVQILGSDDTPVESGKTKFDPHRFLVTSTNSTNPYNIQLVYGESADIAAKIAAEDMTEFPYIAATNNNDSGISQDMAERYSAGEKLWARCVCIEGNGSTINFYYGIHEYDA